MLVINLRLKKKQKSKRNEICLVAITKLYIQSYELFVSLQERRYMDE